MPEKKDYEGHRQRVKERFLKDEGATMADYELLELILMYQIPRQDTKPKAKELIAKFGTLAKLLNESQERLRENGLSDGLITLLKTYVRVSQILHKRALKENNDNVLVNSDQMIEYCMNAVANSPQEEFHVVFLDAGLKVIDERIMARGTVDSVVAYPKEILRYALNYGASSVILYHNHPGGHTRPSAADISLTTEIVFLLEQAGIKVNDHLIITSNDYYSFRDEGVMDTVHKRIKGFLEKRLEMI